MFNSDFNITPKTAHVPQGRSARLCFGLTLPISGVSGLYTYGFTTCNILVAIAKKRIVMVHADVNTVHSKIADELKWAGDADIFLIFRKKYQSVLAAPMLKKLSALMPGRKINLCVMDDAHDGLYVSFAQYDESTIHPNILKKPLNVHPCNLVRHPEEQQFLAVQKIEQLIGLRQRLTTRTIRAKHISIFDGMQWEQIVPEELAVEAHHELTRSEMRFFSKEDTYIVIAGKVTGLMAAIREKHSQVQLVGTKQEFVAPIVMWLEGYLNDFNEVELFARNLRQLLDNQDDRSIYMIEQPQSIEDQNICDSLLALLSTMNKSLVVECDALIEEYKLAPDNSFKKQLLDEYSTFHRAFTQRSMYSRARDNRKTNILQAKKLNARGIGLMKKTNYPKAIEIFKQSLKLLVLSVVETNSLLATAYYNFGRSMQRCNDVAVAKIFFQRALLLRKKFDNSSTVRATIAKLSSVIAECDTAMPVNSSGAEPIRPGAS